MVKSSIKIAVFLGLILMLPWTASSHAQAEEIQQTTILEQTATEGAAEPELCEIPRTISDIGCGQCAYESGFKFSDIFVNYTLEDNWDFSVATNGWKNGEGALVLLSRNGIFSLEEHEIQKLQNITGDNDYESQNFNLKRLPVYDKASTDLLAKDKIELIALLKGSGLTAGTIPSATIDIHKCFQKAFGNTINERFQEDSSPQITLIQIPECLFSDNQTYLIPQSVKLNNAGDSTNLTAPFVTGLGYYEATIIKKNEVESYRGTYSRRGIQTYIQFDTIKFSGDIDRDGLLDFIVAIENGEQLQGIYPIALLVSSKVSQMNPMGIVASDTYCGC